MSNPQGFGPPKAKPKASKRSQERDAAAKRMDKMKAQGMPEFEVYMRIKDKPNWIPVGAITVPRSNLVSRAIYANEQSLLEAAFRMAPPLKKHQDNLDYGYRLKGAKKDEEIELAKKPGLLKGSAVGDAIAQIGKSVTGLFGKKS
ncbi:MAG: hypothetical protein HC771_16865 [Synechococcales cyanobacterium CRU_2_2]|nr:hypothetical protein [Synechococcales cyanobacterium CRU_2_2]